MIDDNVKRKIEKLFELSSNNPSEKEAQSALAKAYALLEKHGLERADVEGSTQEAPEEVGTLPGKRYTRMASQDTFVCWLLKEFFHVTILHEPPFSRFKKDGKVYGKLNFDREGGRFRWRYLFIGRKTNVMIAQYVFAYLSGEFERQWKEHQLLTGKGRSAQLDFYRGLYRGLHDRLATERQRMRDTATDKQREGLVKLDQDDDIDEFMEREFSRLRHSTSARRGVADVESFLSGQDAGKNINIRPAVNQGGGQKALPK